MAGGKWRIGDIVTRRRDGKKFRLDSFGSCTTDHWGRNKQQLSGVELTADDGETVELKTSKSLYDIFVPAGNPRLPKDDLPEYII